MGEKNTKISKATIQWIVSVVFILCGIVSIGKGLYFIFFILFGLIINPKFPMVYFKLFKKNVGLAPRIVACVVCFLLIGATSPKSDTSLTDSDSSAVATIAETTIATTEDTTITLETTTEATETEATETTTTETELETTTTTEEVTTLAETTTTTTTTTVATTKKETEPTQKVVQQNDNQPRMVYITPTGKKYHYDNNCNGGTYNPSTLDEALSLGLEPCKKCVG